jgi:hypothetical protein
MRRLAVGASNAGAANAAGAAANAAAVPTAAAAAVIFLPPPEHEAQKPLDPIYSQNFPWHPFLSPLGAFFEVVTDTADTSGGRDSAPCLQIFQIVDMGRHAQRVLVYSSDARRALRAIAPSLTPRVQPWPRHAAWSGGTALGAAVRGLDAPIVPNLGTDKGLKLLARCLQEVPHAVDGAAHHVIGSELGESLYAVAGGGYEDSWTGTYLLRRAGGKKEEDAEPAKPVHIWESSLLIRRSVQVFASASGDATRIERETFVPTRVVAGLVPEVLCAQFELWARTTG